MRAELVNRGASQEQIRSAVAGVKEFGLDDDGLVREFGEPEDYARHLTPDGKPTQRYGFIVTGLILGLAVWFGIRVAAEAGATALEPVAPFSSLLGLLVMGLGVLAEFLRYSRGGRSAV
ncbi:hypothetical protein [uncultured Arthrobacter sp.]|uniref:hypothetical protein n=1 Tax=uncultured Arthrobacter sp. TaxID=114050 RepID=UPI00261E988D|nr:hypothetical protein [uncultured Arthrobacter sp.]